MLNLPIIHLTQTLHKGIESLLFCVNKPINITWRGKIFLKYFGIKHLALMEKLEPTSYLLHRQTKSIKHVIGNQVRQARLKLGISQMDLAFDIGLTQDYISKVETGRVNISVESLYKICYYLECYIGIIEKEDKPAKKLTPLMREKNKRYIL